MTRILVVGAGATGGALGARLVAAGQDVTFLVRERRAAQLAADGLRFRAPGTDTVHDVRVVTSLDGGDPFDLVIVAVKAPALAAVVPTLTPAVGPGTRVVPLLNGMAHVDALEAAFPGQVLGGIVMIVATLDDDATVVQMTSMSSLTIGGLHGDPVPDGVVEALAADGVALEVVDDIAARLWAKWVFIAAAGVITCLFRGTVGDILAAGGEATILEAVDECERVATAAGHPVGEAGHARSLALLTEPGSGFTSSLYRDLQQGDPVEAEHILGDLAARAEALGVRTPLLRAALLQLRTHHQALTRSGT
ncbi:ketopantoate reductase family protein [Isoptericola cucumis]|uniref:2-dehydropantoate 2-reductase n=1 Tax=Isoptericola cucumis TaxID=1776856 RepID=A0ABQ2B3R2_9MICO|nr:2-dehydropantoate 2-reductase [Isoptericola cucumis]GGI04710.1 2-dehydropantoate 2-reductase [Isoptericola cucumis]